MLEACLSGEVLEGVTPVYYGYIIAFTARRDWGLQDCNVGTPNLCQKGADYIRENKARIKSQYEKYASETAEIWGTTEPIMWLMEPDYFQYADESQNGGGLSYAELGAFMHELVGVIRQHLPNAVISMDISPWIPDQQAWFAAFTMDDFTYMNTSGGGTEADSEKIRNVNHTTWREVFELTGKGIIADDGYGVGGGSIGHDDTWDDATNLNARIADGVVGITQANPKQNWDTVIAGVRPQLNSLPAAPTRIRYATNKVSSLNFYGAAPKGMTVDLMGRRLLAISPVPTRSLNRFPATGLYLRAILPGSSAATILHLDGRNRPRFR